MWWRIASGNRTAPFCDLLADDRGRKLNVGANFPAKDVKKKKLLQQTSRRTNKGSYPGFLWKKKDLHSVRILFHQTNSYLNRVNFMNDSRDRWDFNFGGARAGRGCVGSCAESRCTAREGARGAGEPGSLRSRRRVRYEVAAGVQWPTERRAGPTLFGDAAPPAEQFLEPPLGRVAPAPKVGRHRPENSEYRIEKRRNRLFVDTRRANQRWWLEN